MANLRPGRSMQPCGLTIRACRLQKYIAYLRIRVIPRIADDTYGIVLYNSPTEGYYICGILKHKLLDFLYTWDMKSPFKTSQYGGYMFGSQPFYGEYPDVLSVKGIGIFSEEFNTYENIPTYDFNLAWQSDKYSNYPYMYVEHKAGSMSKAYFKTSFAKLCTSLPGTMYVRQSWLCNILYDSVIASQPGKLFYTHLGWTIRLNIKEAGHAVYEVYSTSADIGAMQDLVVYREIL